MTKQVAVYARVAVCATEDQLLSQIEACRKYAEERGWTVVAEVTDKGMSGATLDRPGLNRIRGLARAGEIDAVVICSLDRLAREVSLVHLLRKSLRREVPKSAAPRYNTMILFRLTFSSKCEPTPLNTVRP
jgi:site-specific DNA recombinase